MRTVPYFYYIFIILTIFGPLVSGQILWYYVSPYLSTRGVSTVRANGTAANTGTVQFSQTTLYGPVVVQGTITGLIPGVPYRVMIHRFGDMTNGCLSVGPIFNPEQVTTTFTPGFSRPVGDLGNVQVNVNGAAQLSISDNVITLHGRNNVIGRSIALHEITGPVTTTGTVVGNVGPAVACGVIGLSAEIP